MKIDFKDRLKILQTGVARVDQFASDIEEKLVDFFGKTKYLFSRTTIYGQLLQVVKDVTNILFYYHEDAVVENNVLIAQKELSVRHFAELSGCQVTRVIPSSGVIRMELMPTFFSKFGNPVYIRKYAMFSNEANSLQYILDIKEDQLILNSTVRTYYLPLIQGEVKSASFVADGTKLFMCEISDTDSISDKNISIKVDGKIYKKKDSLLDMTVDEEAFFVRCGYLEQYQIIFGNGINGIVPQKGANIEIEYITSIGEYGNIDTNSYPTFSLTSGCFDANGATIDIKEEANLIKHSGFLLGSNGDTVDSLRQTIGYNSRGLVLVDVRAFENYLSKYSFLSKIRVWNPDANKRINNILVLPNLYDRLETPEDYFNVPISSFKISSDIKNTIIENITESENTYLTSELVWVEPVFLKYALFIYLEPLGEIADEVATYSSIKEAMIRAFIDASFSRSEHTQDIPKSLLISKVQEITGDKCRISMNIVSQTNEEAKINGFYYTRRLQNGKWVETRVTVESGIDPHRCLTERNDIHCEYQEEVPVLRSGWPILSKDGEQINVVDPVNLYIYKNDDWSKIQ